MTELFQKTTELARKQWQLLLLTTVLSVIFQMDYGIKDENFGWMLLLAVPFLFWCIYTFVLTKLVKHQQEHPNTKLTELLKIYTQTAPKLILPMVGLMGLIVLIMILIIIVVYILFSIIGIANPNNVFEGKVTDPNYLVFYLLFNLGMAFFIFHGALYFIEKQPFFRALKNSVTTAKKHLQFTLIIGLIYFITMVVLDLIGMNVWYKNVIAGIINGLQYYYFAALALLYYEKRVK